MKARETDCVAIFPDTIQRVAPHMPAAEKLTGLSDFFKVMGDGTRIRLLWALEISEMCVCDLAVLLNMTKSAVSHQLKILKSAKLVRSRREGKNIFYSLDDDHVCQILNMGLDHTSD